MSRLLWSDALVPGDSAPICDYVSPHYGSAIRVSRTRALPVVESEVELPDPRVFRSMSRAGILLTLLCLRAARVLNPLIEADPFQVAIYCAIENGPVDFASVRQMVGVPPGQFSERYRKLFSPKMYFRQLPNLAAAQTGIFLGIMGPLHVFTNSECGSLQAVEQAEADLFDGRIAGALVCSAFSFENPLIMERLRRSRHGHLVLCEAAGAMVLAADGTETRWRDSVAGEGGNAYYGISHDLIVRVTNGGLYHGGRA